MQDRLNGGITLLLHCARVKSAPMQTADEGPLTSILPHEKCARLHRALVETLQCLSRPFARSLHFLILNVSTSIVTWKLFPHLRIVVRYILFISGHCTKR